MSEYNPFSVIDVWYIVSLYLKPDEIYKELFPNIFNYRETLERYDICIIASIYNNPSVLEKYISCVVNIHELKDIYVKTIPHNSEKLLKIFNERLFFLNRNYSEIMAENIIREIIKHDNDQYLSMFTIPSIYLSGYLYICIEYDSIKSFIKLFNPGFICAQLIEYMCHYGSIKCAQFCSNLYIDNKIISLFRPCPKTYTEKHFKTLKTLTDKYKSNFIIDCYHSKCFIYLHKKIGFDLNEKHIYESMAANNLVLLKYLAKNGCMTSTRYKYKKGIPKRFQNCVDYINKTWGLCLSTKTKDGKKR